MATPDPAWFDNGPLDLNAKVGIAVGSFVLLLIILGVIIVWNGKRRRRAFLRKLDIKSANRGWPSPQDQIPTGEMFETPVSQRPLNGGWSDSPLSPASDRAFPRYISPYSSQCNSPIAGNAPNMAWPTAALPQVHNIGVALGGTTTNDSYGWESTYSQDKGKGTVPESYELHDVDSSGSDSANSRNQHQHQQPRF